MGMRWSGEDGMGMRWSEEGWNGDERWGEERDGMGMRWE